MPAIITKNLRFHNAEQFIEAFDESSNTIMYVFIGKTLPWNDNLDISGEVSSRSDTTELSYKLYDDMIALKRVLSTDVEYVVPRYNWTSGTVYNYYDHTSNTLFDTNKITQGELKPFYVLVPSNFNVYKCLSNSKGAPSVISPTGESANVVTMGDGYQWKYMYTIPSIKRTRFLNADFMYVTDSNYSSNIDGALDVIVVTNQGSGYTTIPTATIVGDGTGATANVTLLGNLVSNVNIINRGQGYRYANVIFTGGGGSNASARVLIGPKNGHSSNARLELGGFNVMLSPQLIGDEGGGIPVDNDFRVLGLIKDPLEYGTTVRAAGTTYSTRKNLYLANITGSFVIDEYISGSNSLANAVISSVSLDLGNSKANVKYFQAGGVTANANSFLVGDIVTGASSGASGNLILISNEGIQPDSGEILYVDSFKPIQRAADQTESTQLVIQF